MRTSEETILLFRLALCVAFFHKKPKIMLEENKGAEMGGGELVEATPEILAEIEAQERAAFELNHSKELSARIQQIKNRIFNARLPEHLQAVPKAFLRLAEEIFERCPHNRDLALALEALEAAKDAAVRSLL